MDDNKKVDETVKTETTENKKEETKMENTEEKKETKKEKKPGKIRAWFRKNKRELIAGGIGIGIGAAGTYGVSALGNHLRNRNCQQPEVNAEPYNPLDPNVM